MLPVPEVEDCASDWDSGGGDWREGFVALDIVGVVFGGVGVKAVEGEVNDWIGRGSGRAGLWGVQVR